MQSQFYLPIVTILQAEGRVSNQLACKQGAGAQL
jgi:hypothetical protein